MLYYSLIDNTDGNDESEGLDIVGNTELRSKKCIDCCFYYFCAWNFRYQKNVRDECYHCIMYENENKSLIFRVVTIEKKGTYRTVSSYFLTEIEKLLEKNDLTNRKFGWLYKEELTSNENENETKTDIEMN